MDAPSALARLLLLDPVEPIPSRPTDAANRRLALWLFPSLGVRIVDLTLLDCIGASPRRTGSRRLSEGADRVARDLEREMPDNPAVPVSSASRPETGPRRVRTILAVPVCDRGVQGAAHAVIIGDIPNL